MGSDLYLNPLPPPDPIEQIKRHLAWQEQEINTLKLAVAAKDAEIRRLEALLLGRKGAF